MEEGSDIFYYITVMNENYRQPDLPPDVREEVIKGMYAFAQHRPEGACGSVHLLGSGAILREVIAAGELLATQWQVASDVWSVTSFSELAREAREVERYNRLHPDVGSRKSHVASCLAEPFPVIAATDYVAAYPQLISAYVRQPFVALGTDGFGRSDTRQALRKFFEVDRHQIVVAALHALAEGALIPRSVVAAAIARYGIDVHRPPPWVL
jgi:pyruvate dehydrogenase E1 component